MLSDDESYGNIVQESLVFKDSELQKKNQKVHIQDNKLVSNKSIENLSKDNNTKVKILSQKYRKTETKLSSIRSTNINECKQEVGKEIKTTNDSSKSFCACDESKESINEFLELEQKAQEQYLEKPVKMEDVKGESNIEKHNLVNVINNEMISQNKTSSNNSEKGILKNSKHVRSCTDTSREIFKSMKFYQTSDYTKTTDSEDKTEKKNNMIAVSKDSEGILRYRDSDTGAQKDPPLSRYNNFHAPISSPSKLKTESQRAKQLSSSPTIRNRFMYDSKLKFDSSTVNQAKNKFKNTSVETPLRKSHVQKR